MFDILEALAASAGAEKGIFELKFLYNVEDETITISTSTGVVVCTIDLKKLAEPKVLPPTIAAVTALLKERASMARDDVLKRRAEAEARREGARTKL